MDRLLDPLFFFIAAQFEDVVTTIAALKRGRARTVRRWAAAGLLLAGGQGRGIHCRRVGDPVPWAGLVAVGRCDSHRRGRLAQHDG